MGSRNHLVASIMTEMSLQMKIKVRKQINSTNLGPSVLMQSEHQSEYNFMEQKIVPKPEIIVVGSVQTGTQEFYKQKLEKIKQEFINKEPIKVHQIVIQGKNMFEESSKASSKNLA